MPSSSSSARVQLALGTGAFALCFAVFGSLSAMMPILSKQMHLTPIQKSIAVAIPVLLGSLGRIPLGMLTDRLGGRWVFTAVMALSIIPAFLMGGVRNYNHLLVYGFLIGIGLASFSVGVGFVSGWYPAGRQGFALGVYGAGNIGQSLAAFGAPVIAAAAGFRWGFWTFGILLAVWLAIFAVAARNSPRRGAAKTFAETVRPLKDGRSWILSLYYFLTFGGFVAMAIYLPIFLTEMFHLTPQDAGLRTAGFVVVATAMRPVGGIVADKVGGRTILKWVFPLTSIMAIFMACPLMITFTIGALGVAAAIGLGNGAVFKLVPEYFPHSVGSVTGLVGAAGGLGGFFPPLVLGLVKQQTGSFLSGFIMLSVFCLLCLVVLVTPAQGFCGIGFDCLNTMKNSLLSRRLSDSAHATMWGLAAAGTLIAGIFLGSRGLRDFDPALVSYAGASVLAGFGLGYRYAMWLRRPPTRLYWYRGWNIFLEPRKLPRNLAHLVRIAWNAVVLQRFIERRSHLRWSAHWFLAWGCILAAAVTFPLSFGWVRFESAIGNQDIYRAFVFGIPLGSFQLGTPIAEITFNILDIAAVMVLIGVFFAFWRRGRDHGAWSVQQFSNDMLPLILLFAISITGLFLTISTHLMRGIYYGFLSQLHAVTVILTLLYLPFGKFFHIFQRPAQLGVDFYKEEGARGPQALCHRCGQAFASRMHVEDLKQVQAALGIRYQLADGTHYQDICPACRRKNVALTQDGLWKSGVLDTRGQ